MKGSFIRVLSMDFFTIFNNQSSEKLTGNRKIIFFVMAMLSLIGSCRPDNPVNPNPNNGIVVDSTVFFKVMFGGKTISVNQIYKDGNILDADAFSGSTVRTLTSNGQTQSWLSLSAAGGSTNLLQGYYPNLPWQTCTVNLQTCKNGENLGIYNLTTSGEIWDLTIGVGPKRYLIEGYVTGGTNSSEFTLTSIDARYITGFFTCFLIDGPNRIPASGSFRLPYF